MEPTKRIADPQLQIPSLVDNLWEWTRPVNFPSFRQLELSDLTDKQAESLIGQGENTTTLLRYDQGFLGVPAKPLWLHHDITGPRSLERRLCLLLGPDWLNQRPLRKTAESLLWAPGLTCDDVEEIVRASELLSLHRKVLWDAVTVWRGSRLYSGAV